MKKIFYLLLPLLLALGGRNLYGQPSSYENWSSYARAYDESGGKGSSADNPILITSAGQLAYLAEMVKYGNDYSKNKYFKLAGNISLRNYYWSPIGLFGSGESDETKRFCGHFDGNNAFINYVYIAENENYHGFFGAVGSSAEIKNLNVVNIDITGKGSVGGLIGHNKGIVSRCFTYGKITGTGDGIGGLIGTNKGTIAECFSTCLVTGNWPAGGGLNNYLSGGGLVGRNDDGGRITKCYATGPMSVLRSDNGARCTGGLIGINNGFVSECYAGGAVTYTDYPGGLIGCNWDFGIVASCIFDVQGTGQRAGVGKDLNGFGPNIIVGKAGALASGKLPQGFDKTSWQAVRGLFPQLNYYAENKDNYTTLSLSSLSAVPFIPANAKERADSVCNSFSLRRFIPEYNFSLNWSVKSSRTADIFPTWTNDSIFGWVNSNNSDWDELTVTAQSGSYSRTMKYLPQKSFSYRGTRVYNQLLDNIRNNVKIKLPCDASGDITINIETSSVNTVTVDDKQTRSVTMNVSKPGIVTKNVKVISRAADNPETATYAVTVERPFATDIFEQRWSDVLAINNNFATNGGFGFHAYEWYKDGERLNASKGYIQVPGGLDKSAKYTAVLSLDAENKQKVSTCPAEIAETTIKSAVWPNPVQRGQTVHVETGVPGKSADKTILQLFDAKGNIVAKRNTSEAVIECPAPDAPGQYILQLTVNGIPQSFKLIVE